MSSYHENIRLCFFSVCQSVFCVFIFSETIFSTQVLEIRQERDSLHIAEMVKELKQLEYINAFLILFNAQNPRRDESLRAMIDIFTQILREREILWQCSASFLLDGSTVKRPREEDKDQVLTFVE